MTAAQAWGNTVAYTLQIGLVAGVGALVPALVRLRLPRARLLYWQALLVACLALPWVRSWRQEVVAGTAQLSTMITTGPTTPSATPALRATPLPEIALWLSAAGIAIRLGLLGVGLARLALYRRRGRTVRPEPGKYWFAQGATLLLSEDVSGPVTFGWRDPVVLLPANFPSLPDEMREAILCHELLHVERHDWLFTIAEELVRAVLWFHPGIWWVIGEIQLAREQEVDRKVIETTQAPDPYVDALLLMAGAPVAGMPSQFDLAPAPMFLRRRHLKRRLLEVTKEVHMSTVTRTSLVLGTGAAVVLLAAACWLATTAFPLSAAPQVLDDAAGVSVNLNGSQLMHRSSVPYPGEALTKGVEGTVVVQVKLDANGEVSDAAVLSGPDELRRSVLQSVLTWHFDRSAALTTRVVNIDFVKPAPVAAPGPVAHNPQLVQRQATAARTANMALAPPPPPPPPPPTSGKLDHMVVTGLSDSGRAGLLSQLPIQEGGQWTGQSLAAVKDAVRQYDSHLTVVLGRSANGELSLHIGLGVTPMAVAAGGRAGGATSGPLPPMTAPLPAGVYSVGNGVSPPAVISKVDPEYSEEARKAKYSGSVMLSVVIGTDGKADGVSVVKSLGMGLDEKAAEAVQKWAFRPGMKDGLPVRVRAQIEINFQLLEKE